MNMSSEGDGAPALLPSMIRRDSNSSVRSLLSYKTVRESLGKMHQYVDRVSKLDGKEQSFSKKQYSLDNYEHDAYNPLNASMERLNRSHQQPIECISELESENEFSYVVATGGMQEELKQLHGKRRAPSDDKPAGPTELPMKRKKLGEFGITPLKVITQMSSSGVKRPQLILPSSSKKDTTPLRMRLPEVPVAGMKTQTAGKHFKNDPKENVPPQIGKECVKIVDGKPQRRVESPHLKQGGACSLCEKEIKHYEKQKLMRCGHRSHYTCYQLLAKTHQAGVLQQVNNIGDKRASSALAVPKCKGCEGAVTTEGIERQ